MNRNKYIKSQMPNPKHVIPEDPPTQYHLSTYQQKTRPPNLISKLYAFYTRFSSQITHFHINKKSEELQTVRS